MNITETFLLVSFLFNIIGCSVAVYYKLRTDKKLAEANAELSEAKTDIKSLQEEWADKEVDVLHREMAINMLTGLIGYDRASQWGPGQPDVAKKLYALLNKHTPSNEEWDGLGVVLDATIEYMDTK